MTERKEGRMVGMHGVEVVKVEEFKYLGSPSIVKGSQKERCRRACSQGGVEKKSALMW